MDSTPETFRRFVQAATEYDALVERLDRSCERTEFVWALRTALAELLAAGFHLPDVEPSEDDIALSISDAQREAVYASTELRADMPDPQSSMTVADGVADIWRELRDGLAALESGSRWEDVCWEWRFSLQAHWGGHAIEALAALHSA